MKAKRWHLIAYALLLLGANACLSDSMTHAILQETKALRVEVESLSAVVDTMHLRGNYIDADTFFSQYGDSLVVRRYGQMKPKKYKTQ